MRTTSSTGGPAAGNFTATSRGLNTNGLPCTRSVSAPARTGSQRRASTSSKRPFSSVVAPYCVSLMKTNAPATPGPLVPSSTTPRMVMDCCCSAVAGMGVVAVVGGCWGGWVAHEVADCQPSSASPASAQRRQRATGGGATWVA